MRENMYNSGKVLSLTILLWAAFVFFTPAYATDLQCIIEPYEVVDVSSQVPGILDEVFVERGDVVKRGEVLARLMSGVENAVVELARARLDFSERKAKRNEDLYDKELISAHEKDEIETEIQVAKLELKEAQEMLELRTIRSTIDGVVMERYLAPGEYVGEGPIFKVAQIDPLNVEVIAPVDLLGSISEGMKAEVSPEDPPGGKYKGKVVIVDEVVDAASGTFGVRVEVPNPDRKLPAGLKCGVRFYKR